MRIGMRLQIREIKKLLLFGVIIALWTGLYEVNILKFMGGKYVSCMLFFAYGELNIQSIKYLLPILFWIFPQIILINQFGDYLSKNLNKNGILIFTRTCKRNTWFIKNIATLFFYVLIYYLTQFIAISILSVLFGFKISSSNLSSIINMFFLIVLLNYTIILMINIFSLFFKTIYSTCIVVVLNIANIFLAGLLHEHYYNLINILKFLPFTQGIYAWHFDATRIISDSVSSSFFLLQYPLLFSFIYLLVLLISLIILGSYRIKHMDII